MALGKEATILIVILSAAASVVLGFAMYRLCFRQQKTNPFQMSNEQTAYIQSVKARNFECLMMEAGMASRRV